MKPKYLITRSFAIAGLLAGLIVSPTVKATIVYGNGAVFGPDDVYKWDVDIAAGTSTLLRTYTDVGLQPNGNGRGVVIVGNIMYTTDSGSQFEGDNNIYMTDVTTGARLGSFATTIPGTVNLSTLAWDGSQFWSSQYIGGGNAYRFDLSGTVTKTIALNTYNSKDGMEYFNGTLIANRGDTVPPYDVYDLDGNLLTASFINGSSTATGIAYTGTDFLTVNNFNSLDVWDGVSGAFIKNIPLTGSFNPIEDLSVDYAQRSDTAAPDGGGTAALLGISCGMIAFWRKRSTAKA